MTRIARGIVGDAAEPRFAGRRVERLAVDAARAGRRLLRGRTDAGSDVTLEVPRGTYLRHGAVVSDDGESIVVIERIAEPVLVVRSTAASCDARVAAAARVAHALGNQHVPIEVLGAEIRAPITTTAELAAAAVRRLEVDQVVVTVETLRLACDRPLTAPAHGHGAGEAPPR